MVIKRKGSDILIQDLTKMEEYIRAFWQFLPISVCYINPALNILDVSHSFEQLFECQALEIVGTSLKRLFQDKDKLKAIQKKLSKQKSVSNKGVVLISKTSKEIPVSLSAAPRKEREEIVGYFFAFLDATEREKFEQQLQVRIEDLENFRKLAEGRELKMVELKERIKDLEQKLKGRTNS